MLRLREKILSNVKPRKHCRFHWFSFLKDLDILHIFSWDARYKIKETLWILHMIMFDLHIDYETAINIINYLGDKLSSVDYTSWNKEFDSRHAEQFLMKLIFLHSQEDVEEMKERIARFSLMKRTCELSLLRDDPYEVKYRYDTPETGRLNTFADNTIVIYDMVHIFEGGRLVKKINKSQCCHYHGLKYTDPRWVENCQHAQCSGCGIFYDVYYHNNGSIDKNEEWVKELTFVGSEASPEKLTVLAYATSDWSLPLNYRNGIGLIHCFFCDQLLFRPQTVYHNFASVDEIPFNNIPLYDMQLPDSDNEENFEGLPLDPIEESNMKKTIFKSVEEVVKEETVFIKRGLPKEVNTLKKMLADN